MKGFWKESERGGRKERHGAAGESFKTTVNEEQKWRERLRERARREYLYSVPRLIDSFGPVLITRSLFFMSFRYVLWPFLRCGKQSSVGMSPGEIEIFVK